MAMPDQISKPSGAAKVSIEALSVAAAGQAGASNIAIGARGEKAEEVVMREGRDGVKNTMAM